MSDRYEVYGVVPSEHEDNNPDLKKDQQKLGGTVQIYSTDDREEAKTIVQNGGFMKGPEGEQQWYAAQWAKDTETGGTIGAVPEGAV